MTAPAIERQAPFSRDVRPDVRSRLVDAAAARDDGNRAEAILWSAHELDPRCFAVYFALYKFYFYKGMLREAEQVALMALATAAAQGEFNVDWNRLDNHSAAWANLEGPAHFYLFSLKALTFIRLRQGKKEESLDMLAKLQELDPKDTVGGSVIRELALRA